LLSPRAVSSWDGVTEIPAVNKVSPSTLYLETPIVQVVGLKDVWQENDFDSVGSKQSVALVSHLWSCFLLAEGMMIIFFCE